MIAGIMAFLHLIPGFTALAQFVVGKVYDSKVAMYQARCGVTRDVAVAAIQGEVANNQTKVNWIIALAKNPVMLFIVFGFAMPFIAYEWKAIAYDKVWMSGTTTTDLIAGPLADWATIILTGIFVSSTGMGIAHAIVSNKDD